jgi:hypothetical protein
MNVTDLSLGIAWFLIYLTAVYAAIRSWPQASPAVLAVLIAAAITIAAAVVAPVIPLKANYWRVFATASFLMLVYLMVFGATYKSISLHILHDLWQTPSRKLPIEHILARYIQKESFSARIQVMLEHGWATQSSQGITLSPKGRWLARSVRFVQRLYNIEKSG